MDDAAPEQGSALVLETDVLTSEDQHTLQGFHEAVRPLMARKGAEEKEGQWACGRAAV